MTDRRVKVGQVWLGSTGNHMKVLHVDTETEPGEERALLGHVGDEEDQSWSAIDDIVRYFTPSPCPSTCGIGILVTCAQQEGHVPPHRLESYGGLYTSWRVEWFTVDESERP